MTSGTNSATYAYATNSGLVDTITYKNSSTTRLTTAKVYDQLNRLASVTSTPSVSTAVSHAYDYNAANQRTRVTRENSAYWSYGYDSLGQVTSGQKFNASNAALPGHDFAWTYDDIGNRKTAVTNGQTATYTSTSLNQYSGRTVPGAVDVLGAATTGSTVTVSANGGTPQATTRSGELFFQQLAIDNASSAQLPSIKVTGVKNNVGTGGEDAVTEITKTPFVAQTPEGFGYDSDGNLTSDARWSYTWDGENRLIVMQTSTVAAAAGAPNQKLEFVYDGQGRRVSKKVSNWTGSSWALASQTLFLYDGWNMVAELNALSSNAAVRTYVWGLDLSGSAQGAGGVGGLLVASDGTNTWFAAMDGNGNVAAYVTAGGGTTVASYDYNAFGETIVAEGTAVGVFPWGFSTKYADAESGLLYYGFRYYNPSTGRWLSRDPIHENGGLNLYGMLGNDLVNEWDFLGFGFPGDPMDPNTALAEVGLLDADQIAAQQLIRQVAAREAAKQAVARAAAAAAAAAAANSIGGDSRQSCPTCSSNPTPQPVPVPVPKIGPIPKEQYPDYQRDNKEKNRICKEPPPTNLNPCDLLRWKLDRKKRCIKAREDMLKYPFKDAAEMAAHLAEIANMKRTIPDDETFIKLNCPPQCNPPPPPAPPANAP